MAYLEVRVTDQTSVFYPLSKKRVFVIGRAPNCDVIIADPMASQRHARVEPKNGGKDFILFDFGSSGGLWVNNEKIDEIKLEDGMVFTVGKTELRFRLAPPDNLEEDTLIDFHKSDLIEEEVIESLETTTGEIGVETKETTKNLADTFKGTVSAASEMVPDTEDTIRIGNVEYEASFEKILKAAKLEFLGGPRNGTSYLLKVGDEIVMGRSNVCDLPIDDNQLSRRHCMFKISETDGLQLSDLHSTNGTFLNKSRIEDDAPLKTGDLVQFGTNAIVIKGIKIDPIGGTDVTTSDSLWLG